MMSFFPSIFSFQNLSQCIYIGNTTLVDENVLLNYCTRFGSIASSLSIKDRFRDFNIIEYKTTEQFERFINYHQHQINNIPLDVRLYKQILINNDTLHIDRKFFLGPILNSKDEKVVVQFYKSIDSNVQYYLTKEEGINYLLLEFNNRQTITRIFDKQSKPQSPNENHVYSIYKPLHPKQFVYRIISMNNKQNQILIYGLTKSITRKILIDYFQKYAPVLACIILPNNSTCAIMEFNERKIVNKILNTSQICINDVKLTLTEVLQSLASILNPNEQNSENKNEEQINIKSLSTESVINSFPTTANFISSIPSSSQNNHSGWASPPRNVNTHSLSIDQPSVRTSSKPCTTTNSMLSNSQTTMDIDIKPNINNPPSHLMQFYERIQIELEQIRYEYQSKFDNNQRHIDQEIRLLINEERHTFDKLQRYLSDQNKQTTKRNKRKASPSVTNK